VESGRRARGEKETVQRKHSPWRRFLFDKLLAAQINWPKVERNLAFLPKKS
jgi:hypothetical protein